MDNSIPTQRRFPASAGLTVRAAFDGGAMSSDFGARRRRGADLPIGLIPRLVSAIHDKRHASYIDHSLADLLRQRIFQTASGYADGNDANTLRRDPMFKRAVGRAPLDEGNDLASGPTLSRLENSVSKKDIYRLGKCFVEAFIARYAKAPAAIVLDMDHSEDITHGQQERAFYHHHYGHHCDLPLFLFEGLSGNFITAVLRPGKRPTGQENAAIIKRVLRLLRQAWPETPSSCAAMVTSRIRNGWPCASPMRIWTSSSAWPATRGSRPRPSPCWNRPVRCTRDVVSMPGGLGAPSLRQHGCTTMSRIRQVPGPRLTVSSSRLK